MRSCAGSLWFIYRKARAIYVVDRGFVDFPRLPVWHQAGAFFVTRAKSNMDAQRIYSAPADRSAGIICGRTIALDGSIYAWLQILSVTLFEKIPMHRALGGVENK